MNELRYIDFKKAERLFEARKTVLHTANFIYFMAAYTALNSFLSLIGQMRFVGLALNICTVIDEMINNAPRIMIIIGLFINLLIISFFIYLAIKSKKKELWAYRLALILYIIDTFLVFVLPFENKISNFLFHALLVWLVWSEYNEYKDYFILEMNLYLPDWALTEQSNVLFIKKTDFELQSEEASQILFYKKACQYQEQNKPANAIEYYSKAIDIWKCIPIVKNQDKDWYAMSLMNRAILEKSIRSRNDVEILKDLILAYNNYKVVLDEEVKLLDVNPYTNHSNLYSNYDYVSQYFTQCSYHLLSTLKSNLTIDRSILKYGEIILGITSTNTKYLLNEIYLDSLYLFENYQINIWENLWTLKILKEITIPLDNYHTIGYEFKNTINV